jgi:hypothetical protein
MDHLTADQVLALAPDSASAKAGQGLASPGKWVSLGRGGRSVWGECQGSGKLPYRTQADLSGPAFNCSCPSRKFPCKHGLGLLLLLAANPGRVAEAEPPAWVTEWLAKREASAEKKATKAQAETEPPDAETAARREADREKRAAKREDRVRAGLQELQTLLGDVLRQGLAHAKQQPTQFWDGAAARMIDAQAPGVARRLRSLPGVFASGDAWADRTLEEMGALQWLLHGFAQMDSLPDGMRASVRSAIGWTFAESELTEPVSDRWQVIGQRLEEEDRLRVQRTWLVGTQTGRFALSLSFAAMNQPLDVSLVVGTEFNAQVVFFPSAAPLRATVREGRTEAASIVTPAAQPDFAHSLDVTATLLAGDPWLERIPWFVRDCVPFHRDDRWQLRDAQGATVPLSRTFQNAWPLRALSGGRSLTVFGEWDGRALLPLSAMADGRLVLLGGAIA